MIKGARIRKAIMGLKIKSLKWQLLIRSLLILIALLVVMGTFQHFIMKRYLLNSKIQILQSKVSSIDNHTISRINSPQALYNNADILIRLLADNNTNIAIISTDGELIGTSAADYNDTPQLSSADYSLIFKQQGDKTKYKIIKNRNNEEYLTLWLKTGSVLSGSGLIQISTSVEGLNDILRDQIYVNLAASILILFIGIFFGGPIINRTLKPLLNVTKILKEINVGQLNKRLPVNNNQVEIDSLSNAFNTMLKDIEISFEKEKYIKDKMQRFISDASHELRTPLTSIHGFVEVLLSGAAKNEAQLNMALKSILNESERLTLLVNELLILTKLDQQTKVEFKKENLSELIKEIYPQLVILGIERKIELNLKDNIFISANKNQIKQILLNVVQNSIQHTNEKDGIISINLNTIDKTTGSFAVLQISDNGTGIPDKDLNEIFDRFFRSETHRSRKYGGYGLGLAIVKSIVDSHSGDIQVNSSLGRGTVFTIYFKLAQ